MRCAKFKFKICKIGTNKKLGKMASFSRTVGSTCPSDCPFLCGKTRIGRTIPKHLRCYAKKVQDRYPSAAAAWGENVDVDSKWAAQLSLELMELHRRRIPLRAHVGGDVGLDDKLDENYLTQFCSAINCATLVHSCPEIWLYTHMWRELARSHWFLLLRSFNVAVFASVHSTVEAKEAKALGYSLALDPGYSMSEVKENEGKVPARVEAPTGEFLTCPAQLSEKVTCAQCKHCRKGKDVIFWQH